jgi:hypothetical protein
MRVLILAALLALMALGSRAAAPSDVEILVLRAEAAEAESRYLISTINRMISDASATADYWKAYVAGLSKQ